jgi:hypothetical protein
MFAEHDEQAAVGSPIAENTMVETQDIQLIASSILHRVIAKPHAALM